MRDTPLLNVNEALAPDPSGKALEEMLGPIKAEARDFSFHYGDVQALRSVSMPIAEHKVTALIGPSGCGKSTLLRSSNPMHDLYPGSRYEGATRFHPDDVNRLDRSVDPIEARMRIGMVFQKPNPFPRSIFDNVAYGLRVRGAANRARLAESVERALRSAALWDEVKDRPEDMAFHLCGGQQQRLGIARALAVEPEPLLFDEPTSALDPVATASIEEPIDEMKERMSVLIVTHDMQQAGRVSDFTAFLYLGELIELDATHRLFTNPKYSRTESSITGRFG